MISYSKAIEIIEDSAPILNYVTVPLSNALNRVCTETIYSPMNVPNFDNSAMDGFALRAEQTHEGVQQYKILGSIAAGDKPPSIETQPPMSTWEIMTGAPLPKSCNAVIKVEETHEREGLLEIKRPVKDGENIRRAGEDFKEGQVVLASGSLIQTQHQMALAALGINDLKVRSAPRVALICTGAELETNKASLSPGKIYNSNRPYLTSELRRLGAHIIHSSTLADDPQAFHRTMREILEDSPDIILTTGAVSMGKYDFITSRIGDLKAKTRFHKVAIRPGKPILFAQVPRDNEPPIAFFGLPGNPISAVVGLRFFVEPYLRKCQARPKELAIRLRLKETRKKPKDLRCFLKATTEVDDSGEVCVAIHPGQMSFMIHPLLEMNTWAILPEGTAQVPTNTLIDVLPFHSWEKVL